MMITMPCTDIPYVERHPTGKQPLLDSFGTCLVEDGQLFSWGYPQHGRLGHSLAPSQAQVTSQPYHAPNTAAGGHCQHVDMQCN